MKRKLSLLVCTVLMLAEVFMLCKTTEAVWIDISGKVTTTTTRQSFDRSNRVFFSYVKITNNSGANITGPARFFVTSTSIPVSATPLEPDGYEGGTPFFYFLGNGEILSPKASKSIRLNFQSQRKQLTYTVKMERFEGSLTTYYRDSDGDGFGNPVDTIQAPSAPKGYVEDNIDCNDSNNAIHPEATEICGDGVDQNCNEIDFDCLYNAQVTPNEVLINTSETITVSTEICTDPATPVSVVEVFRTDSEGQPISVLCTLYDDGTHGDATAGDNGFTGQFIINESAPLIYCVQVNVTYYDASIGLTKTFLSPKIEIDVYKNITNEEIAEVFSNGDNLKNNFDTYLCQYNEDTARDMVLQEALTDEAIENAVLLGDTLTIRFKNGITGVSRLITEDEKTQEENSVFKSNQEVLDLSTDKRSVRNRDSISAIKHNVLIYAPEKGFVHPNLEDIAPYPFINTAHVSFNVETPNIKWSIDSPTIDSLEIIKKWNEYDIILIESHGYRVGTSFFWGEKKLADCPWNFRVGLSSGIPVSKDVSLQGQLLKDATDERLVVDINQGRWVIMPSYIYKYCPKLSNNPVFWLGFCHSLANDTFWDELKDKGAKIAFGFDRTTHVKCDNEAFRSIMLQMFPSDCLVDPKSAIEACIGILHILPKYEYLTSGFGTSGYAKCREFIMDKEIPDNPDDYCSPYYGDTHSRFIMRAYKGWFERSGWENFKFMVDQDGDRRSDIKCDNCIDKANPYQEDTDNDGIGDACEEPLNSNGLVGYYPFNGDANDKSGNGNNGIVYGGATPTQDRFGQVNSAYAFDGIDDYIHLGTDSSLKMTDALTISVWINMASFDPAYQNIISDHAPNEITVGCGKVLRFQYSTVQFIVGGIYGYGTGAYVSRILGNEVLGQWLHLAGTYDRNTIKLFINGTQVDERSYSAPLTVNPNPILIANSGFPVEFLHGSIDEVRIYNRALSESEIQELYSYKP